MQPALSGGLDGLIGSQRIGGWVWLPGDSRRVTVDIMDGARLAGRTMADMFRQDLQDAGIGDGRHGFEFTLPAILFDGAHHAISVRAPAAYGGGTIGQPCSILLPLRAKRRHENPSAAAILRRVLAHPETVALPERAASLALVLSRVGGVFGEAAALDLLYIHCLGRPIEPPAVGDRIAHLRVTNGDFTSIVEDVLSSDEMTRLQGSDKLASMPPDSALTAWLVLATAP